MIERFGRGWRPSPACCSSASASPTASGDCGGPPAGELHGHSHAHYDHVHDPGRDDRLDALLLFSADPCVAVIPLLFAAAPLGAGRARPRSSSSTKSRRSRRWSALVLPARAGVRLLRAAWLDHYGDAVAGAVIAAVGLAVAALGW